IRFTLCHSKAPLSTQILCLVNTDSEPTDRAFVLFRNEFGITPVNNPGVVCVLRLVVGASNVQLHINLRS
ncbi:MAG: hypothetical protein P4L53_04880, partial [Candidatus Obscuribacterales bacterium]|nr:hypothetical protein [Candidatus Obscuribacterales bacterium]